MRDSLHKLGSHDNQGFGEIGVRTSRHFEVPASVCVCELLVVAALTKGGYPEWAVGA
jgi:hypothetical protein